MVVPTDPASIRPAVRQVHIALADTDLVRRIQVPAFPVLEGMRPIVGKVGAFVPDILKHR